MSFNFEFDFLRKDEFIDIYTIKNLTYIPKKLDKETQQLLINFVNETKYYNTDIRNLTPTLDDIVNQLRVKDIENNYMNAKIYLKDIDEIYDCDIKKYRCSFFDFYIITILKDNHFFHNEYYFIGGEEYFLKNLKNIIWYINL